jgi:DNA-binding NarL/FixJ family response regulator
VLVRSKIHEAHEGNGAHDGEVVLVDEHPLWLDALETVLSSKGMRVIGKTTSPEAALDLVGSEKPDALIASIELPSSEMGGVEFLRRARRQSPDLRIVAFSTFDDALHLSAAASAGADAYLPKTADASEVAKTVRECLCDRKKRSQRSLREREPSGRTSRPALTARELEIVQLVSRGYTNGQIAQKLWVSRSTVKFHLINAYRKLGVSNRTQAARYLFDHGLSAEPVDRSA